jgi:hypothetical protein
MNRRPTVEFSRRERIQNHRPNANDLAREAVGCNAVFGGHASLSAWLIWALFILAHSAHYRALYASS